MKEWTLLSNHGHVLVCLVREPTLRLRDVAQKVGITERAVQGIVADLERAGYVTIHKEGRCNRYAFNREVPLRHNVEAGHKIGELMDLLR